MDTIWIVVLIVVALIVVAGIMIAARKRRDAQLEERRAEARDHREDADATARRAEQARLEAQEQADRARKQQEAADDLRRRADEVDPDVTVDEPRSSKRREQEVGESGCAAGRLLDPRPVASKQPWLHRASPPTSTIRQTRARPRGSRCSTYSPASPVLATTQ